MKASEIVLDASALLASHERNEHAALGEKHATARILAPTLLAYEVANVVHRKKPDSFGTTTAERSDLVATLLLDITLVAPNEESIRSAGRIAEEDDLTGYDAAYLALAEDRRADLVTEDEALAKAASRRLGRARVSRLR